MAVYVDESQWPFGRMIMCHMVADTLDELHEMAESIGIRRKWFQDKPRFPHYDISKSKREIAVSNGAMEITARELVMHTEGIFGNCKLHGKLARDGKCDVCEGRGIWEGVEETS